MVTLRRKRISGFAGLLVAVAAAGAIAGLLSARDSVREHSDSPTRPLSPDAQAEQSPEGLIIVQQPDPAIEFPAALEDFPGVGDIAVGADGKVWFVQFTYLGTTNKLYRYDPASGPPVSFDVPASFGSELFSGLGVDARGHVIVAEGYQVVDFDPAAGTYALFPLADPSPNSAPLNEAHNGSFVTDMEIGENGRAYISRMNVAAVTELDLTTGGAREIPFPPSLGPAHDIATSPGRAYITSRYDIVGGAPAQTGWVDLATGSFSLIPGKTTTLTGAPGGLVYAVAWPPLGLVSVTDAGLLPASASLSAELTGGLGALDFLAVDQATGGVWATGASAITRLDPLNAAVRGYSLPIYSVDPRAIHGVPDSEGRVQEPEQTLTQVRGLAVAPNGDLYFSAPPRIGVIHADR